MKNFALLAFALFLFNPLMLKAQQNEIAAGKKIVIAEIISVTNADKKGEETMLAMFKQFEAAYPEMIERTLDKSFKNLPPVERQALKIELMQRAAKMNAKFNERLQQRVNLREYVEQAIYPLYDKFFTESELKDLLVFYKTPIGQKLNQISPQMAVEGIRLAQELLLPKIMTVVDELVQEDISNVRKTPAARKRSRN